MYILKLAALAGSIMSGPIRPRRGRASQPVHYNVCDMRGQNAGTSQDVDYDRAVIAPTPANPLPAYPPDQGAPVQATRNRAARRSGPYKRTVGKTRHKYEPLQSNSRGSGLVVILANNENSIAGIDDDINKIEEFYTSNVHCEAHYKIIGGKNDPEKLGKRDLTLQEVVDEIIHPINQHYSADDRIAGAEYDRVIFHLFSHGNFEYVYMKNTCELHQTLVNRLANEIPNLQKEIPAIVFIHTCDPPRGTVLPVTQPAAVGAAPHSAPNVLSVHTRQGHVTGHGPQARGSLVLQSLLTNMRQPNDLVTAVKLTNQQLQELGQPEVLLTGNQSKQFYP